MSLAKEYFIETAAVAGTVTQSGSGNAWGPGGGGTLQSNLAISDNTRTVSSVANPGSATRVIELRDFGFPSLPARAQLLGILLSVEGLSNSGVAQDKSIRVTLDGVETGDDKATHTWSIIEEVVTYGALNDAWKIGPFGIDYSAIGFNLSYQSTGGADFMFLDHVTAQIAYRCGSRVSVATAVLG